MSCRITHINTNQFVLFGIANSSRRTKQFENLQIGLVVKAYIKQVAMSNNSISGTPRTPAGGKVILIKRLTRPYMVI
jgi:hypothetical protein